MRMSAPDGTEVMQLQAIERMGNNIALKTIVMGALPMTVLLTPSEARKGLRMIGWRLLPFLVTFIFRR